MRRSITRVLIMTAAAVLALVGWVPVQAAHASSGIVHLQFMHSGKCLTVPGNTQRRVQLTQVSCGDYTAQRFVLTRLVVNGQTTQVLIQHYGAGCATVRTGSYTNGVAIYQNPCGENHYQWFRLIPVPGYSGWYYAQSTWSNKCIRVSGSSQLNRAGVVQYTCYNTASEWIRIS